MAFQYYGGNQPPSTFQDQNPFSTASQQPSGGGMPQMPMGLMNMFGEGGMFGGGGGAAGGGAAAGETAAAGATGGAGSAAGGAGSSAASGMASAGPWAALAAVIIANEYNAKKGGYRDENSGDYAKDLLGGKVLTQDIEHRWAPKLFGKDKYGFGGDMNVLGELSSGDFSNAWDRLKNESTIGKLFHKIF